MKIYGVAESVSGSLEVECADVVKENKMTFTIDNNNTLDFYGYKVRIPKVDACLTEEDAIRAYIEKQSTGIEYFLNKARSLTRSVVEAEELLNLIRGD